MIKLIIFLVLLAVSFYVVKLVSASWKRRSESQKVIAKNKQQKQMVKCDRCGVHFPEYEAIKHGDNVFCSLKHANQHQE